MFLSENWVAGSHIRLTHHIIHSAIPHHNDAVQAMPEGGRITLKASNVETVDEGVERAEGVEYIKISIIDTGIGIQAANLNKIFDPFFTTKEKGTD